MRIITFFSLDSLSVYLWQFNNPKVKLNRCNKEYGSQKNILWQLYNFNIIGSIRFWVQLDIKAKTEF